MAMNDVVAERDRWQQQAQSVGRLLGGVEELAMLFATAMTGAALVAGTWYLGNWVLEAFADRWER